MRLIVCKWGAELAYRHSNSSGFKTRSRALFSFSNLTRLTGFSPTSLPPQKGGPLGLTKRKDGWYVEFPVLDDGKMLTLAGGKPGAKIKRWKTGTPNRTIAKQQEALIKADLMKELVKSERVLDPMTFRALADVSLSSPDVRRQATYKWKVATVGERFVPRLGHPLIDAVSPRMVEAFREEIRQEK